ncbi:MAG: PAS domain-containing protein [Pseudomonadota bacterium]
MENDISLEFREHARADETFDAFQLTGNDVMQLLAQFDSYGLWRMDVETGLVYWSLDVFKIHGLPYREGPVDVKSAIEAYHEDDREFLVSLLEDTVENKGGFRFVLRLKHRYHGYKLVKSTGCYRINSSGRPEVYGTFSEFQTPKRAIASYSGSEDHAEIQQIRRSA